MEILGKKINMDIFGKKKEDPKPVVKQKIHAGDSKTTMGRTIGHVSKYCRTIDPLKYDSKDCILDGVEAWLTPFYLTPKRQDKINQHNQEMINCVEAYNKTKDEKFLALRKEAYESAIVLYPKTEFGAIDFDKAIPEDLPAKPIGYSVNLVAILNGKVNGEKGRFFAGRKKEAIEKNVISRINDFGLKEAVEKYYNDFLEVNDGAKPFGDNIIGNWIETSLGEVSRKQFTIYGVNGALYAGCDSDKRNVVVFNPEKYSDSKEKIVDPNELLYKKYNLTPTFEFNESGILVKPKGRLIAPLDYSLILFGKEICILDTIKHPITGSQTIKGYDHIALITPKPVIRGKEDIKLAYKF